MGLSLGGGTAAPSDAATSGRYRAMIGMIRIATMFATLIIGLIAGPGGVLVGIADGVAGDRGGVGLGALAAERTVLDQLLRVVPGAATAVIEIAMKTPTTITPINRPPRA